MNNTDTIKTTNFERCYKFLNAIYFNKDFRAKREAKNTFTMMKRYHKTHKVINEFHALALNDLIEQAKKLLKHPERASSEPKLCAILEDMERIFSN